MDLWCRRNRPGRPRRHHRGLTIKVIASITMHSTLSARTHRTSPARATYLPALVIFLILGILTTLWALASPLMTVPDEPSHAIKAAAVARGELQAQSSGKQGDPLIVQVPLYIAELGSQTCTAFKNNLAANCAPEIDGSHRTLTAAPTTAGNYNPFYYLVVGLPSRLLTGAPAVYAMRIVSGLMSAAFLTAAFLAARKMRNRQWPLIASAVTLTPMALYLAGSINPNSLEIATTAAFFLNLCAAFENYTRLKTVRFELLVVGISGFVLANTRALSLLWLGIAFIAAVATYGWKPLAAVLKSKLGATMTALAVAGCIAGLGWLVVADSFKSLGGIPSEITPDQAFITMLDRTFDYVSGYIGYMGWLDTMAPSGVMILWHFFFGAMLVAGLTARPVRNRWALIPVLAGILILPPLLQSQVIQDLGYIWQGRYLLALVGLLFLVCGVALSSKPFISSQSIRTAGRWILGAAVVGHLYAFLYALRRFTVGLFPLHTNWSEMGEALWQPPLTWQVLTVVYLLVLVAGALLLNRSIFPRLPHRGAPAHQADDRFVGSSPLSGPAVRSEAAAESHHDDGELVRAGRGRPSAKDGSAGGDHMLIEGDTHNGK